MIIVPVLMLGAHLTIAVADPVPTFNVEPSCRQAASGDIGIKQDLQVCLEDEKGAREQLVKEWGGFATGGPQPVRAPGRHRRRPDLYGAAGLPRDGAGRQKAAQGGHDPGGRPLAARPSSHARRPLPFHAAGGVTSLPQSPLGSNEAGSRACRKSLSPRARRQGSCIREDFEMVASRRDRASRAHPAARRLGAACRDRHAAQRHAEARPEAVLSVLRRLPHQAANHERTIRAGPLEGLARRPGRRSCARSSAPERRACRASGSSSTPPRSMPSSRI